MSERLQYFQRSGLATAVSLPFSVEDRIHAWVALRSAMVRERADEFTRDEWAYLIGFLDESSLRAPWRLTFGEILRTPPSRVERLARPRGSVVVWLPNNVSLLGPLVAILLSLTGNNVILKEGSRAESLTHAFLGFARVKGSDQLRAALANTSVVRSERDDADQATTVREADVVIVFGSDAAVAAAAEAMRPGATLIPFGDRRSEAWLSKEVSDSELVDLIKVFAIYGQAGCTSPSRVVVLGDDSDAEIIADRLLSLWPARLRAVDASAASANFLAAQLATLRGGRVRVAPFNSAVIVSGHSVVETGAVLPVVAASRDTAVDSLPPNIQTIGHNLDGDDAVALLANTRVKRIVPIRRMHHFGPTWDGRNFWSECFEYVEVSS